MWWCCGKGEKDEPGCKFSKHESRDDADAGAGQEQLTLEEILRGGSPKKKKDM